MHDFGLINYAERRGASISRHPCYVGRNKMADGGKPVSMTLNETTGAFIFLAIGLLLAALALTGEIIVARLAATRKQDNSDIITC